MSIFLVCGWYDRSTTEVLAAYRDKDASIEYAFSVSLSAPTVERVRRVKRELSEGTETEVGRGKGGFDGISIIGILLQ